MADPAIMAFNMKNHPRRPPADQSVSLLHSPRVHVRSLQQKPQRTSDSSSNESATRLHKQTRSARQSNSNSPSSLNPLAGKHSSGESSNAEKWFEKSNYGMTGTSFADNDPPFFLRNPSSFDEQAEGQPTTSSYMNPAEVASSLQQRTGLLHLGTDASSTEDFRNVIDDLTIENKKLKRRLKKYEKLHDAHLKDEKLFEVRVHGLPPAKKIELEEMLRNFATEVNDAHGRVQFPPNGYSGLPIKLTTHKTASSSTSLHNTDSAYASMSASGPGSSALSDTRYKQTTQSARSRHQNIHTYLHHIPEGLLPLRDPETMTERARKKSVVRRLEQIFAGTGAAAGGHQQALQQQDVSHSAARADRREREAAGHSASKEGIREASILRESCEGTRSVQVTGDNANIKEQTTTVHSPERCEQRPTRPLDLDPHRAQVPAENLQYIRHLGFSLPDPSSGSPVDDEGWIYLNLLVNMAQLHTINVTHDFVRKAIDDFSDKFEVSADGRKVRWRGGASVTRTSSNGGTSSIDRTDDDSYQSPRKRVKLSTGEKGTTLARSRNVPGSAVQRSESGRLAYTPLFFHKDSTGDEDSSSGLDYDDDDGMSQCPQPVAGNSSGMTSSGIRTTSTKNRKHDDGPIIFYNNVRFCTDLSGDIRPTISPGAPMYKTANVVPVGMPDTSARDQFFERRGPLADVVELPEAMDLSDDSMPRPLKINLPGPLPTGVVVDTDQPDIELEVTGIGGIYPADHFSIAVESRRAAVPDARAVAVTQSKALPPRIAQHFQRSRSKPCGAAHVSKMTVSRRELPPSALPPALSYMLSSSDSYSDDGSETEDRMSVHPESLGGLPSLAAPQQLDLPYAVDESDADMDYFSDGPDSDVESDSSLDLLASARVMYPDIVRAREREYDANMAEPLAEEIPAGSSAATAGGGSGFNSPVHRAEGMSEHKAELDATKHQQSNAAVWSSD